MIDAPPTKIAEIIRGTFHLQPLPSPLHALAITRLAGEIGRPFNRGRHGPGGWWTLNKPELHLGEEIVVPDLAGWRRERMPRFPRLPYFTLAPDWVCEILSPATRALDIGPKRAIWREHGVGPLWHVDPDARSLEVFPLHDGAWVEVGMLVGAGEVRLPPFEAVGFPLEALWPDDEDPADDPAAR